MNFLLHRHLAHRELGSAEAGLGAMLPDLWRLADRRVRARADVEVEPCLLELQRGVVHHLAADAWFHRTRVFVAGERQMAQALRRAGDRAPKLGLFAHIGWEMCLDGALLLRDGLETHLNELRDGFAAADREAPRALARAHAGEGPERFHRRMGEMRRGLLEGSWIAGYCDPAGLCDRLQGMRARFGFEPFGAAERARLEVAFADRLRHAGHALDELLQERQRMRVGHEAREAPG